MTAAASTPAPSPAEVLDAFRSRGLMLATAESCTGGMVAAALTDVPGSSAVVERGFVSYANRAKTEMLGVDPALIEAHGAVSEPVARAMAEGALACSPADAVVAITGVAGPGGTEAKPEGLVWFAVVRRGAPAQALCRRFGPIGRDAVRRESVAVALTLLLGAATGEARAG